MSLNHPRDPAKPPDRRALAVSISLKARALRLLSLREYSRHELATKLQPHAAEKDDLQVLLDELIQQGWLNDERAAQSLIHRRAEKLGMARLRSELQALGIDGETVVTCLSEVQETELSRASAVWHRKFGYAPSDAREQGQQTRFLLRRGFAGEVVRTVLKNASKAERDDQG